jgi:hypothetical protein
MPIKIALNNNGDLVSRYQWHAKFMTPKPWMNDALREWRKQAIKDRDEFLSYQKSNSKDREAAKFFKENASYQMKLQRACGYMLPWIGVLDANQSPVIPDLWPVDLADALDEITRRLILREYEETAG